MKVNVTMEGAEQLEAALGKVGKKLLELRRALLDTYQTLHELGIELSEDSDEQTMMPEEESKVALPASQCLPEALKKARHNRQLTRGQVAQAMGLHPKTISAWESGAKTPRPSQLWDLARLYCCGIDELTQETPCARI